MRSLTLVLVLLVATPALAQQQFPVQASHQDEELIRHLCDIARGSPTASLEMASGAMQYCLALISRLSSAEQAAAKEAQAHAKQVPSPSTPNGNGSAQPKDGQEGGSAPGGSQ